MRIYRVTVGVEGGETRVLKVPSKTDVQAADAAAPLISAPRRSTPASWSVSSARTVEAVCAARVITVIAACTSPGIAANAVLQALSGWRRRFSRTKAARLVRTTRASSLSRASGAAAQ